MESIRVCVSDMMQTNFVYLLTEPIGKNFHPDFKPELSPKEMLELGVFGGKYMTDCMHEYPQEWFTNARLCHERHVPELNYFGVNASKPLSYWRERGWIHSDDPRGWFQWYCRYYMGRRCIDDHRQISRWKAMTRHIAQLKKNCPEGRLLCRRKQRQALLHWAYDSAGISEPQTIGGRQAAGGSIRFGRKSKKPKAKHKGMARGANPIATDRNGSSKKSIARK